MQNAAKLEAVALAADRGFIQKADKFLVVNSCSEFIVHLFCQLRT